MSGADPSDRRRGAAVRRRIPTTPAPSRGVHVERRAVRAERSFGGAIGVGDRSTSSRTVTDADLTIFAGLSTDMGRLHLDDAYAAARGETGRTVHESLLLAWMAATAGALHERTGLTALAYGLDQVRFFGSVHVGERITFEFEVASVDEDGHKCFGLMRCRTVDGTVVAQATQIEYLSAESFR
jgi:3-hydroxybutyryl-CoA dehydratase